MAAPTKQPKQMSSRLNNMKFMQRAGASTPSTPSEPPSKRQRLSNGSAIASPALSSPANASSPELSHKDDSKWYLSFKAPKPTVTETPLRIVSAGFATIDAADASPDDEDYDPAQDAAPVRPALTGRQSFGKFNRKIEKQQNPDLSASSSSESESEGENDQDDNGEEDDPTGVNALIRQGRKEATERARAERKAKKAADLAESQKLAEQRRKKNIDLNNVKSISNGGGSSSNSFANMTCYTCNKKGHRSADCPDRRSGRPSKLLKR